MDQATIDFLRSDSKPVTPLEEVLRIQETLDTYPTFKVPFEIQILPVEQEFL